MTKRRSKTLLQQAKYYEVEGDYKEQEMMSIMESAYINGNFSRLQGLLSCAKDGRKT